MKCLLDFQSQFVRFLLRTCLLILLILISTNILIPKGLDVLTINGLHTYFLDLFFSFVTHFGNAMAFIPLIAACLFIEFRIALMAGLSVLMHGALIFITKKLLFPHIARPSAILDNDLLYFIPGIDVHTRYSFPSGHTATIFAIVIFICLLLRKKSVSIVLLTFAMLVGISRIYLLQHFLLDVAGGAFIGIGSAIISILIFDSKKKWPTWMSLRIKVQLLYPKQKHQTTFQ